MFAKIIVEKHQQQFGRAGFVLYYFYIAGLKNFYIGLFNVLINQYW